MAKAFSLVCWNVEHFRGKRTNVGRIQAAPSYTCLRRLSESNILMLHLLSHEDRSVSHTQP